MFFGRKILVISAIFVALNACKKNTETPQQQKPQDVSVIELKTQDIPLTFEYSARAQGSKETEVRARVGGILLKRNYTEGAKVNEGDILFEIDPAPYKVALDQAKAQLSQAKAQYANAQTQWKRTNELFKEGFASAKTRDEAKANLDSLKASVELGQSAVDAVQLNLDYTTVKAPISGITSLEAQSEGSLISTSGDASLLTKIVQIDPVYVIFSLSENELMSFRTMTEQGLIKTPENKKEIVAKLKFSDGSVYAEGGEINFINPMVDEQTGTIKLRAVFKNPENKVLPGQFLRLVLDGLTRINAISLPKESVMQEAGNSYVYRVNNEGIVEEVVVQTGLSTPDGKWIIDSGLNPNDKIVANGLLKLRSGMKVNPVVYNPDANISVAK